MSNTQDKCVVLKGNYKLTRDDKSKPLMCSFGDGAGTLIVYESKTRSGQYVAHLCVREADIVTNEDYSLYGAVVVSGATTISDAVARVHRAALAAGLIRCEAE